MSSKNRFNRIFHNYHFFINQKTKVDLKKTDLGGNKVSGSPADY